MYIYGIDQADSQPNIVFTLGSTQATHHYTGSERFAYNALFFSTTGLAADQTHTVSWIFETDPSTGKDLQEALFDYAIVTSGTDDAAAGSGSTTGSTSGAGTGSSGSSSGAGSSGSNAGSGSNANSGSAAITSGTTTITVANNPSSAS